MLAQSCFNENPKRFLANAETLESAYGWTRSGTDPVRYEAPSGQVAVEVGEGMIDATCTLAIEQGVYDDDYDFMADLQARIDDMAGTPTDPVYEGEAFVWRWSGTGAYQMQSYEVGIVQNAGTRVSWSTE